MIRQAKECDAEQVCSVLRISITELCYLDHREDIKKLHEWLENKTVKNCKSWIGNKYNNAFVAEINKKVVGVSIISNDGYVLLCYILPEVKGKGVGSQLLRAAEESVLNIGVNSFSLESTITAKGFYEHHGYTNVKTSGNRLEYAKTLNQNR